MLLLASKVLNVSIPIILKSAIDSLADSASGSIGMGMVGAASGDAMVWAGSGLVLGPIGLVIAWGAARAGTAFLNELRSIIFSKVWGRQECGGVWRCGRKGVEEKE